MSEEVKTQETEKGTKSKTPAVNPNISRMMEEREELSRDAVMSAIEDNDWLKIPDSLIREFYDEGFVLRWIRIMLDGQEDFQNIGKKEREGWTFCFS